MLSRFTSLFRHSTFQRFTQHNYSTQRHNPTLFDCDYNSNPTSIGADIVLVGAPLYSYDNDKNIPLISPAQSIRNVSHAFATFHREFKFDPFKQNKIIDAGDFIFPHVNENRYDYELDDFYDNLSDEKIDSLSIGGDHKIYHSILKSYQKRFNEPISIINFDSSADLKKLQLDNNLINHKHSILIGQKGHLIDNSSETTIKNTGLALFPHEKVMHIGTQNMSKIIKEVVSGKPTIIMFDLSALNLENAPAVTNKKAGGFNMREIQEILRKLKGTNIVGSIFTGLNPSEDINQLSSIHSMNIIYELLTLQSYNKNIVIGHSKKIEDDLENEYFTQAVS